MRLDDPSGNIIHAQIKIGDSPIDIAPEQGKYNRSPQSLGGSTVPIGLYVEDVDAFAEKAIAAGAKVIFPIDDWFYGDRSGRLEDPFGHMWIVSTHKEDVAPEEMTRRVAEWMKPMPSAPAETPAAEVAGAPEGYHSITPYLQVKGASKLIEFLTNAFGAEEIFRVPRGDEIAHAQLKIEGSMIEVADAIDKYQPNPTAIWLFVKDADATYARALKAGATSLHEPADQDYGDREASVKDPFGNHWYIGTHRADAEPLPAGHAQHHAVSASEGRAAGDRFPQARVRRRGSFPRAGSRGCRASREDSYRRFDHRDGRGARAVSADAARATSLYVPIPMRPTNARSRRARSQSMSRSMRVMAIAMRA